MGGMGLSYWLLTYVNPERFIIFLGIICFFASLFKLFKEVTLRVIEASISLESEPKASGWEEGTNIYLAGFFRKMLSIQ